MPINIEGICTKDGYQTPAISNVAKAILDAPTKLLIKSFKPNCLNSLMILSNLNTQTNNTDTPTTNCTTLITFSITFLLITLQIVHCLQ